MDNQNGSPLVLTMLLGVASLLMLFLSGCGPDPFITELVKIREKGKLTVLTRQAPTTFYVNNGQRMGFEHDLIMAFARHLQVTPEFVVMDTTGEVYEALRQGRGDIAAAGFFRTEEGQREFRYGPIYGEVQELVVCRRGNKLTSGLFQLNNMRFRLPEGSSHEPRLNELQQQFPEFNWERTPDLSTEQVLEKVWNNELDCTIADSNILRINQHYYPELQEEFSLGAPRTLSWVLPKSSSQLQKELAFWFQGIRENGMLEEIHDRYYGFTDGDEFDYVDVRKFHRRIETRLPYFINLFKKAEKATNLPWTLLAALSYQESHWNPWAVSPTGVRGVMMLTNLTAQELRITNRLDPEESIMGAAGYLNDLMRRLPEEVVEPDRLWIALAAYNIGMGHVLDARELARRLNRNPDSWVELREVLPLLANHKYFETLKYGFARGKEPVHFVHMVRLFSDILEKKEEPLEAKDGNALFRRAAQGQAVPNGMWEDWQDLAGALPKQGKEKSDNLSKESLARDKVGGGTTPPVGEFGLSEAEEDVDSDAIGSGDEQPQRPPTGGR